MTNMSHVTASSSHVKHLNHDHNHDGHSNNNHGGYDHDDHDIEGHNGHNYDNGWTRQGWQERDKGLRPVRLEPFEVC